MIEVISPLAELSIMSDSKENQPVHQLADIDRREWQWWMGQCDYSRWTPDAETTPNFWRRLMFERRSAAFRKKCWELRRYVGWDHGREGQRQRWRCALQWFPPLKLYGRNTTMSSLAEFPQELVPYPVMPDYVKPILGVEDPFAQVIWNPPIEPEPPVPEANELIELSDEEVTRLLESLDVDEPVAAEPAASVDDLFADVTVIHDAPLTGLDEQFPLQPDPSPEPEPQPEPEPEIQEFDPSLIDPSASISFEDDLRWVYANLSVEGIKQHHCPRGSTWWMLQFSTTSRVKFFEMASKFFERERKLNEQRDVARADDRRKSFRVLQALKDQVAADVPGRLDDLITHHYDEVVKYMKERHGIALMRVGQ